MTTVTLSSKFQLSLPKSVREALRLQAGQRFLVMTKGEVVTLVPERDMAWARGRLKGASTAAVRSREDQHQPPAKRQKHT